MSMMDWTVTARWSWDQQRRHMVGATDDIIREVAEKRGVTVREILSREPRKEVYWARHEAIYRIRKECPWMSYPMIGRKFGRDHSTAVHSVRRYAKFLETGSTEEKREGRTTRKEEERMASTLAHPVTEAGA
jgi:chromosomal replication initiation ATPase DnaA